MVAVLEQGHQRERAGQQSGVNRNPAKAVLNRAEGVLEVQRNVTAADPVGGDAQVHGLGFGLAQVIDAIVEIGRTTLDRWVNGADIQAFHFWTAMTVNEFRFVFQESYPTCERKYPCDPSTGGSEQAEF